MNTLNLSKDDGVKLKPCPFCGSGKLKVWDNSVVCLECDTSGPDLGHCVGEQCRKDAMSAWNRRHNETPSEYERLIGGNEHA